MAREEGGSRGSARNNTTPEGELIREEALARSDLHSHPPWTGRRGSSLPCLSVARQRQERASGGQDAIRHMGRHKTTLRSTPSPKTTAIHVDPASKTNSTSSSASAGGESGRIRLGGGGDSQRGCTGFGSKECWMSTACCAVAATEPLLRRCRSSVPHDRCHVAVLLLSTDRAVHGRRSWNSETRCSVG
jgi:hypothetical protein